MSKRIGIVFGWIGTLATAILLLFFARLAFNGQLTWNFWPTTLFIGFCFFPYFAGRALRFIFSAQ